MRKKVVSATVTPFMEDGSLDDAAKARIEKCLTEFKDDLDW